MSHGQNHFTLSYCFRNSMIILSFQNTFGKVVRVSVFNFCIKVNQPVSDLLLWFILQFLYYYPMYNAVVLESPHQKYQTTLYSKISHDHQKFAACESGPFLLNSTPLLYYYFYFSAILPIQWVEHGHPSGGAASFRLPGPRAHTESYMWYVQWYVFSWGSLLRCV